MRLERGSEEKERDERNAKAEIVVIVPSAFQSHFSKPRQAGK